jgi:beta-phosphoglucomutase-like phosphatase (HAD superfamily)
MPALPGVTDYIQAARRLGLRLALASSSPHAWVEGYLRQLGLKEDFDAIICREDVRRIKPDPELFLTALEALKLGAAEALVFEDSPNGVLAACRAGLRVVAVTNPITAHARVEGASLVLASMAEVSLDDLLSQFDPGLRPGAGVAFPHTHLVD